LPTALHQTCFSTIRWTALGVDTRIAERAEIEAAEEILTGTEKDRRDDEMHLIDEAGA
jgi:hypothetical protein